MKSLLFISFLCLFDLSALPHDVAIAMFQLAEKEDGVELNFSLDKEDFMVSSGAKLEELSLSQLDAYLNEHMGFKINGEIISFEFSSFSFVQDHIKLIGVMDVSAQTIKSVEISNTCMIDIPNHSNIIRLDLKGQNRDFRMHKDRTEINLEY